MAAKMIGQVEPYVNLYRDTETGIAWVADGRAGVAHTCHPNIHARGVGSGLRARRLFGDAARLVTSQGFIYNVEDVITHDAFDRLAARFCECKGCVERRIRPVPDAGLAFQACRQLVHAYKKGASISQVVREDLDPAAATAAEALGETLDAYPEAGEVSELEKEGIGI